MTTARRGGRAVECTGLENRSRATPDRGFESRPLRPPGAVASRATFDLDRAVRGEGQPPTGRPTAGVRPYPGRLAVRIRGSRRTRARSTAMPSDTISTADHIETAWIIVMSVAELP